MVRGLNGGEEWEDGGWGSGFAGARMISKLRRSTSMVGLDCVGQLGKLFVQFLLLHLPSPIFRSDFLPVVPQRILALLLSHSYPCPRLANRPLLFGPNHGFFVRTIHISLPPQKPPLPLLPLNLLLPLFPLSLEESPVISGPKVPQPAAFRGAPPRAKNDALRKDDNEDEQRERSEATDDDRDRDWDWKLINPWGGPVTRHPIYGWRRRERNRREVRVAFSYRFAYNVWCEWYE